MKKAVSIAVLLLLMVHSLYAYDTEKYWHLTDLERSFLSLWDNTCKDYKEIDIPTIFVPWILASWYSQEWYDEYQIKRWLPDPITHVYDPLFFTFKRNWYTIKDVFYKDQFTLEIKWNPKSWFYLFWYDWKKDNKISATLLTQLIWLILKEYEKYNWCNIWKVNIIAHSMWWLVSRSMLEDMCVEYWLDNKNWTKTLLQYNDEENRNWKLKNFDTIACQNPFSSATIWKDIKINKFITIATPHRWSPKALPIWEKWDIIMTDWFWLGSWLKSQLTSFFWSNEKFYGLIHGYNSKVPNWIVTIGQLLPDIENNNDFNKNLSYLEKENTEIPIKSYPKNSFLEELNKEENINKIWDKIEWGFTSYYSTITWNNWVNNIVWFNLWDKIYDIDSWLIIKDKTDSYTWKDIYDKYSDNLIDSKYNITNVNRNEIWKWWDWTVPSSNLKLVPNNSITWKEIKHEKFKSEEIKCYDDNAYDLLWIVDNSKLLENPTYEDIWIKTEAEICNHTNMPTASSYKVLNNILWKTINTNYERSSILYNLWYINHSYSPNHEVNNTFTDENFNPAMFDIIDDKVHHSLSFWDHIVTWVSKLRSYEILSPINITIEDEKGRKIWIDPETGIIVNEIPGAWTSWDTEWTGEPEFFIIPITDSWSINHEIKTYWTWDWEYDIVIKDLENSELIKQNTIEWDARESFWEDYSIKLDEKNDIKFINNTKNTLLSLEINNTDIKTTKDIYKLRYFIRWNYTNVDKIQYTLYNEKNKVIKTENLDVKWALEIPLENIWKYKSEINLLNKSWKVILTKNLDIEKVEEKKEVVQITNNYLEKEINTYFEEKYAEKLKIIKQKIASFDFHKKQKLRKYISENKENILNKIRDDFKKKLINFFLTKIEEYIYTV